MDKKRHLSKCNIHWVTHCNRQLLNNQNKHTIMNAKINAVSSTAMWMLIWAHMTHLGNE